jgi:hypothetical protein
MLPLLPKVQKAGQTGQGGGSTRDLAKGGS